MNFKKDVYRNIAMITQIGTWMLVKELVPKDGKSGKKDDGNGTD